MEIDPEIAIADLVRLCDEQHTALNIALGVLSRHMKNPDEIEPARTALENGEIKLMKLKEFCGP